MHIGLKIQQKILTALAITIIFFGFTEALNPPPSNWYQQFLPNIGSQQINDIIFLDSLTGFAVSSRNVNPDSASILKTTNGGNDWQIVFTQTPKRFNRIQFINSTTGFVCGGSGGGTPQLYKTTDAGQNWSLISSFGCSLWKDMFVLDENTIWLADNDSFCGGVYLTTNGGVSWNQQFSGGNQNPNKIYMYNARIGFMCNTTAGSPNIYKTTNGGANWLVNLNNDFFYDIHFVDSLTGWKCRSFYDSTIKKTTNGGLNWSIQHLPTAPNLTNDMEQFSMINKDTIFGIGGYVQLPNLSYRAVIYKTLNGGANWGYQIPDTSFHIPILLKINFINKNIGWAYNSGSNPVTGIHTLTGGDTTIYYTGLKQISSQVPIQIELKQNYPNPFNPVTNIRYSLNKNGYISLKIYDITGKVLTILVLENQRTGTYQYTFESDNLSSGVYFYTLKVRSEKEIFTDTKKMILLK